MDTVGRGNLRILLCGVLWAMVACGQAQTSIAAALAARGHAAPRDVQATTAAVPPATLEAALHEAFLDAAVVFAGEVTAIDQDAGSVVVRWHIEQAIHGVSSGDYTLREWAGAWSGHARYHVGQRALVMLRAPSVAGYAAPVADGIVPLTGSGFSSTVDLRWLARHVAVSDEPRMRPALALQAANGSFAGGAALLESAYRATLQQRAARPVITASDGGGEGTSLASTQTATDATAHVDGSIVFDMLRAWQRTGGSAQ